MISILLFSDSDCLLIESESVLQFSRPFSSIFSVRSLEMRDPAQILYALRPVGLLGKCSKQALHDEM